MQLQHFGNTFMRLQVKSPGIGDSVILLDPFQTKTWGGRQPKMDAEVVISTDSKVDKKLISKEAFVITTPGEYETREISIYGADAGAAGGTVYVVGSEDIKIGHVGSLTSTDLSAKARELLDSVDVLCVPIGGGDRLDGKQAARLVQDLEPRMVIPLYYKFSGVSAKVDDEKAFLKELGIKKFEETQKLTLKKKDLPQDEMVVTLVHI
ncbi:MAG: MBL fold metallo-hydrolase [Patescibacteria group bacterium]